MSAFTKSLSLFTLLVSTAILASDEMAPPPIAPPGINGWSFDIGGQYTWMSFTSPPTYSGSTGGVIGKITYQTPWAFFGQARTVYNLGPLSSSTNRTRFYEWYMEFVGGYCFPLYGNWSFTPYVGVGIDYLSDNRSAYSTISAIKLRYSTYYAVIGFDTHYAWKDWMLGLQFDCFPEFNQFIRIKTLSGASWTTSSRVGFDGRLPVAYRLPVSNNYLKDLWLELTPYYRFFPIGSSSVLSLPERNLNQWGFFLTLRFAI